MVRREYVNARWIEDGVKIEKNAIEPMMKAIK